MNLEVYTFTCLLKEFDEAFCELSLQEQYDAAPKYYKDFLASKESKESSDLVISILKYLEKKYELDVSLDLDFEDF
jgi:hypothetical protein